MTARIDRSSSPRTWDLNAIRQAAGAPAAVAPEDVFDAAPVREAQGTVLHHDGGIAYDPQVEQLQRELVEAGLMTQAQMDTGPGHYGPRTRAAVALLKELRGISGDGTSCGPAARVALQQFLTDPTAKALLAQARAAGRLPDPSFSGIPGDASGGVPSRGGTVGNVPYISQMSSEGSADDWNAASNCGPTTMAMIAKGLGFGRNMQDGDLINHFCQVAGVGADGTGYDGIATMARSCGFSAQAQGAPSAEWVRSQLAQGKLVAANGNRSVTLQYEQPPYASGSATGGHWIAVVGVTEDGNFLVQDPSTTCKVLTPAQLEAFFSAHGGDGGWAVAIGSQG
jgi:hypothetical protein